MSPTSILESQQSAQCQQARRSAAGCWKLKTGTALSLRPRQPGVLEVAEGRFWVTGSDHADHVLEAGQRMTFAAGEHVVLEVWAPTSMDAAAVAPLGAPRAATSAPAAFRWDAALVARPAAREWEEGVAQPLRELLQAAAQTLAAAGRLAKGMARVARHQMTGMLAPSAGLTVQCEKSING